MCVKYELSATLRANAVVYLLQRLQMKGRKTERPGRRQSYWR